MLPKITVCCFIKDNNVGAFCLWESMAMLMSFADEFIVMDLGSTDGTLENLKALAVQNRKLRIEHSAFYRNDNKIFADLANDVIAMARNDLVLYYQADEVWHENLCAMMLEEIVKPNFKGLAFWRYQLEHNFQQIKWWPHIVQRLGFKQEMKFVGDGMNAEGGRPLCSHFDGGWASKWEEVYRDYPTLLPTHEMILDVSSTGAFLENVIEKRQHHAPLWGESSQVIYLHGGQSMSLSEYVQRERENMDWYKTASPFEIPGILRDMVGVQRYHIREDVMVRIAQS